MGDSSHKASVRCKGLTTRAHPAPRPLSPGAVLLATSLTDSFSSCFQMCGIALTAECIFFVSDQHSLYPLLEATNNDDIFGAAWIGMFVGICLFCLSVLAIVGIMKSNRKILLAVRPYKAGDVAQLTECLPSTHKILGSVPSTILSGHGGTHL
jgi:hypothetical protein